MADSGAGHPIIPEAVLGATSKIAAHLEELKRHLHAYLELAEPDALAALPSSLLTAIQLGSFILQRLAEASSRLWITPSNRGVVWGGGGGEVAAFGVHQFSKKTKKTPPLVCS